MNIKTLLATCLLGLSISIAHAEIKEGVDYTLLKKPIPQLNKNKIEVLEFFAYFCIHCKHLEPVLLEHSKAFPDDTYLRQEHVVWDPQAINLARVAAAVNASGTRYQAGPAIFETMFTRGADGQPVYNLNDPNTFKKWATEQGSWGKAVIQAFDSPTNLAEAKNMEKMTYEYGIDSSPQIIVGGQYKLKLSGDFAADMVKLDELITKVRKERGLTTQKSVRKPVGAGASFATQANH